MSLYELTLHQMLGTVTIVLKGSLLLRGIPEHFSTTAANHLKFCGFSETL
jgi:hypothetical protein